ncbi:MAG: hypothetical protein NZ529_11425, partial [Cytophagaceae bacterium]|nr:hypothetical protein [Cytophagaceae bacterium]MDW8457394.1 hypothetical protein [Cytophagaceae bacterium]
IIIAYAIIISFESCKKDDTKTATKPSLGVAKVSGIVDIDTDFDTPGIQYLSGIKVIARANSAELVNNPSGTYSYPLIVKETFTDASGKYSFELPVGDKEITYTIETQDKEYMETQYGGIKQRVVYNGVFQTITLYKGSDKVLDFSFY